MRGMVGGAAAAKVGRDKNANLSGVGGRKGGSVLQSMGLDQTVEMRKAHFLGQQEHGKLCKNRDHADAKAAAESEAGHRVAAEAGRGGCKIPNRVRTVFFGNGAVTVIIVCAMVWNGMEWKRRGSRHHNVCYGLTILGECEHNL